MKSNISVQHALPDFFLLLLFILLAIDLITIPVSPTAFLSFPSLALPFAHSADPSTDRFVLSATSLLAVFLVRARPILQFLSSYSVQTTGSSVADVSLGIFGLFFWTSNVLSSTLSPSAIQYAAGFSLVAYVALTLWSLYLETGDNAGNNHKEYSRMVTEKSPLLPRCEMTVGRFSAIDARTKNVAQDALLWVALFLTASTTLGASSYLTWNLGASPATLPLIPATLTVALSLCSIWLSQSTSRFLSKLTLLTSFHAILSYTIQVSGSPVCGVWDPLSRPDLKDVVPELCMVAQALYYAAWTTVLVFFYKISSDRIDWISDPASESSAKETGVDIEKALVGI